MDKQRTSFIFRKEWYDAISALDDASRLQVYDAIMKEVWGDGDVELSPVAAYAMRFISLRLGKDAKISKIRQEAGRLGGLANGSKTEANGSKTEANGSKTEANGSKTEAKLNEEPAEKPKPRNALDLSIVDPLFLTAVETWLSYKREKGQPYKPSGFKMFYKRLVELSGNNPQIAMAIIEESMVNNYAGIFPLKESGRAKAIQQEMFTQPSPDVIYNTWSDKYTPFDGQVNQRGEVWNSQLKTWLQ